MGNQPDCAGSGLFNILILNLITDLKIQAQTLIYSFSYFHASKIIILIQRLHQINYDCMRFSRRRENEENTYLIEKYGLESVQTLIDYLQDQYCNRAQNVDLKKAQKLQEQLRYLKNQRSRHFNNTKLAIIDQIMDSLEEEKQNVLYEFEEQRKTNLAQIVQQAQQIELQMQNQHMYEMKKLEGELDKNYDSFVSKKSQKIIDLTYQLEQLCMREEYDQAEFVRQALQAQINKFRSKKHIEWKDHRENQIKVLELKQEKQRNSLRSRLQTVVNEQIEAKNREFEKLVKKIGIHQDKIYKNLMKQTKYKKQLTSLATSRLALYSRQSRDLSRIQDYLGKSILKVEPETGPTSQAQTDRLHYENNQNQK